MNKVRTIAMLVVFLTGAVIEATQLTSLSSVSNGDLWWHLSAGLWMLQHRALPQTGILSQSAALSWTATSWGYEVLLASSYRLLELRAIPALLICLRTGLAVITFLLAGGLRGKLWPAMGLSAVVQFVLGAVPPGPGYFSLIFFGIELLLLLESRRKKSLFWLVPLFMVWANFDIQFVYGLALFALFVVIELGAGGVARRMKPSRTSLRDGGVLGLSIVAGLLNPHWFHPYVIFWKSITSAANRYLPDVRAMSFHQPQDYVLLLLTMAAFLALGRRRSRDIFLIAVLVFAAMLSFYAQRNTWMVSLVSIAVIGEQMDDTQSVAPADTAWNWRSLILPSLTAALLVAGILLVIPGDREVLLAKAAQGYPVAAGNYIRDQQLPQPLFNAYEWGGFLTWYLPQYPVAIDGRADLYGDDFIILYSKAMNADVPYTAFPAMNEARTLVLPKNAVMAEAMSTLPGFKVAYSDEVSVVLTREVEEPSAEIRTSN